MNFAKLRLTLPSLVFALVATLVPSSATAATPASSAPYSRVNLASGVQVSQESWYGAGGPEHAWLASVDLNSPRVRARVIAASNAIGGRRETTQGMAARSGSVVGINGDFFSSSGAPLGGAISNRTILRTGPHGFDAQLSISGRTATIGQAEYRANVATLNSRTSVPLRSVNHVEDAVRGWITELTPALRVRVATGSACLYVVGISGGGMLWVQSISYRTVAPSLYGRQVALMVCGGSARNWLLRYAHRRSHLRLRQAVGPDSLLSGGRVLVSHGRGVVDNSTGQRTFGRNPETAVCVSRDRHHLLMVVIDGRTYSSVGVTMEELTSFLVANRCYTGLMLDGGGSSTFVGRYNGAVRTFNHPSDRTGERGVPNGLFITS